MHARLSAIETPSGARTLHVKKSANLHTLSFRSIDFKMELVPLKYRYSSIKSGQNIRFVPFHQFLNGTRFVPFQQKNGTVT